MPTYIVTGPDGKKLKLTGDSPPTDEDLDEIFASRAESKIKMKDPESKLDVDVPQSKVITASDQGLRLDTVKPVSKLDSLGRGAGQGVTLGLGDELAASSSTYGEALDDAYGMGMSKFSDPNYKVPTSKQLRADYLNNRDQIREEDANAQAANPKTYLAGQVLGSLAAPVPKIKLPIGATSTAGKIGKAALEGATSGAITGGINGAGSSDAENLDQLAIDSITGAGIGAGAGGLLGGAFQGAAPYAGKLADSLRQSAKNSALSGAGSLKSLVRKNSADQISKMGDELVDNPKLNKVFETGETKLANLKDLQKEKWNKIEDIYNFVDKYDLSNIDLKQLITKIKNSVGKSVATAQVGTPAAAKAEAYQRAITTFDDFLPLAKKNGGKLSLQQGQDLRKQLNDFAYRGTTPSNQNSEAVKQVGKDIAGKTSESLEDALQTAQNNVNAQLPNLRPVGPRGVINPKYNDFQANKDVIDNYNNLKDEFGTLKNIEPLTKNLRNQELGNLSGPNLKSTVAAASGNPILQTLGAYTTRPGQRAAAKAFNSSSQAVRNADGSSISKPIITTNTDDSYSGNEQNKVVINYNSDSFDREKAKSFVGNKKVAQLLESDPQSLGKYAEPLQKAKQRGEDQFNATLYVLMSSDPEFRTAFQDSEN